MSFFVCLTTSVKGKTVVPTSLKTYQICQHLQMTDVHLKVLGLRYGSSLDEVKKAYKAKALLYHPDRNENGADHFKLVQTAYEYFMQQPSRLTTPSFSSTSATTTTTYSTSSYRQSTGPPPSHMKPSTPFFSEAELFGDMSDFGDFGKSSRRPKNTTTGSWRNRRPTGENPSSSANNSPSKDGENPPTPPPRTNSVPNFFEDGDNLDKIRRDRARAKEGNGRTPLSAYNAFDDDSLKDFLDQHRRFEEMEAGLGRRPSGGAAGGANGANGPKPSRSPESRTPEKQSTTTAGWRQRKFQQPSRTQQAREFEEAREEAQRKLDAAETMERMEREARKKRIDEETKREWEELMSKMKQETEQTNVDFAIHSAKQRVQQEAEADRLLRSVAADRRRMKGEEFARTFPSTTSIGAMPEADLVLLKSVMEDRLRFVNERLSHLSSGACSICHTSKRNCNLPFICDHHACCELCFDVVLECPVCGASKGRKKPSAS